VWKTPDWAGIGIRCISAMRSMSMAGSRVVTSRSSRGQPTDSLVLLQPPPSLHHSHCSFQSDVSIERSQPCAVGCKADESNLASCLSLHPRFRRCRFPHYVLSLEQSHHRTIGESARVPASRRRARRGRPLLVSPHSACIRALSGERVEGSRVGKCQSGISKE
jgi:hypothetical protein